ncbi:hypothetical protein WICMUC_004546 [Wickerhamomyces mucosus]|uniref:Nuclear speckle splicing regulatory protein 1 N-terminal domain-containing protein n=1 Tax=Wickerhamomyces mucosus TaxID=1378264 RepID=A0A9P8PGD5_9ASCO|nr:hypothetical protein WICMUC_004546 [Wickerhamomyces mucosus]
MKRSALGFDSDNDSDEDIEVPKVPYTKRKPLGFNKDLVAQNLKNQAKSKEFEESNPDIYQYDEVFDDVSRSRKEQLRREEIKKSSTPQYIAGLQQAKLQREEDKQRVQDLKIAKERELEGDQFKDKEVFITSSYKEHRENLARSRYKEDEESVIDVEEMRKFQSGLIPDKIINYKKNDNKEDKKEDIEVLQKNGTPIEERQLFEQPKSRLLPKLSDKIIQEYRERYYQRKLNL